jgi:hypothetical protein
MEEEFPLIRNGSLAQVPEDASATKVVDQNWRQIRKLVLDGHPYDSQIKAIEDFLIQRKSDIKTSVLKAEYDWKFDIASAEFIHRFKLGWIDSDKNLRAGFLNHWERIGKSTSDFLLKITAEGLKAILLVHGAAAVGALNVIIQSSNRSALIIGTSKFVLVAAIIGMIAVAIGQMILLRVFAAISWRVRGKIITNPS